MNIKIFKSLLHPRAHSYPFFVQRVRETFVHERKLIDGHDLKKPSLQLLKGLAPERKAKAIGRN